MKKLFLIRHAKSDWPEEMSDFDRPLAKRGIEDAEKMALFLKNKDITIDLLVSSPAKRALETARIFNKTYEIELITNQKLYHPSETHFLSTIYELQDQVDSVAFFSHNNGISNFANFMSEDPVHFPTCGIACFEISTKTWSDFEGAKKKRLFFYEPKKV